MGLWAYADDSHTRDSWNRPEGDVLDELMLTPRFTRFV
jgi:hypothetical protein